MVKSFTLREYNLEGTSYYGDSDDAYVRFEGNALVDLNTNGFVGHIRDLEAESSVRPILGKFSDSGDEVTFWKIQPIVGTLYPVVYSLNRTCSTRFDGKWNVFRDLGEYGRVLNLALEITDLHIGYSKDKAIDFLFGLEGTIFDSFCDSLLVEGVINSGFPAYFLFK